MWLPPLTDLQRQWYLNEKRKRIRMVYGARCSGKTIGVEQSWMHHGWHNEARVAFITRTNRQGNFGIWPEFTEGTFGIWNNAGIGSNEADFGWARQPWRDSISKIEQCQIFNKYGTRSTFVLFPIEKAKEARDKLLSTVWSGVWISEGHLYRGDDAEEMAENRQILDTAISQLRFGPCPFENRMVMIDTNPPDEGPDHWLYPPFFTEMEWATNNEWPEHFTPEMIAAKKRVIEQMERMCMPIESNTFLHPDQKADLIATYAHDPILYRRYIGSEWIAGSTKGVFGNAFRSNTHVMGDISSPDENQWQVIAPDNGVNVEVDGGIPLLLGGWDIGDVNHAWAAIQPVYVGDKVHFRVLDEVVCVKQEVTIGEFTEMVMERMDALEKFAGFPVTWRHFSDSSAFEFRAAISRKDLPEDAELTDAAEVYRESKGRISLVGSANVKRPGWVRKRVNYVAMLLRKNRIVISANCKGIVDMFRGLRKGETRNEAVALGQKHKHAWDAMSYAISMFALDEIVSGKQTAETQARASVGYA